MTQASAEKNRVKHFPYATSPGGGFTKIFRFDARPLCESRPPSEEGILYANVDLKAKMFLDVVGHYSCPSLLSLRVNTHPSRPNSLCQEAC